MARKYVRMWHFNDPERIFSWWFTLCQHFNLKYYYNSFWALVLTSPALSQTQNMNESIILIYLLKLNEDKIMPVQVDQVRTKSSFCYDRIN